MELDRGDFSLAISRYCRIGLPRAFSGHEVQKLQNYPLGHGPKLMDLRDGVAAMTGYPSGLKVRNPPCPVAREIRFLARCLMRRRMSARRHVWTAPHWQG